MAKKSRRSKSPVKPPTASNSKYTLVPPAEVPDVSKNTEADKPSYEDMIVMVLENNISSGVTKQTILNRLKSRWNVQDRYAKPAIKSALKKMRAKRKVKRTVDGLYKKSKPRKVSRKSSEDQAMAFIEAALGKNMATDILSEINSEAEVSSVTETRRTHNSATTGRKTTKAVKTKKIHSTINSHNDTGMTFSSVQSGEWSSDCEDSMSNDTQTTVHTKLNSATGDLSRKVTTTTLKHDGNISSSCPVSTTRVETTNTNLNAIGTQKSYYSLHENWPSHAEVLKTHLMTEKNQIREVLLRTEKAAEDMLNRGDALGDPTKTYQGLSRDELVYQIMTSFPSSSETYTNRRQKIELALKDMQKTCEVTRCVETGLLMLERKLCSRNKLNVCNMDGFIESLLDQGCPRRTDKNECLYKCLRHFKTSTYSDVVSLFEMRWEEVLEGLEGGGVDNGNIETDEDTAGVGVRFSQCKKVRSVHHRSKATEQIRITCPCCRNDLMVTINYNKEV